MNSPGRQLPNMLLEISGEKNSRKNEGMEPKQKQHPVVNGTGDGSRVRCCREQYCIGTWNVRSVNLGKLELVKQEMTRVNINILGIGELRWPGMDEFNSNDHYITTVVRSPLEEMEQPSQSTRIQNAVLSCNFKNDRKICSFPRQTIQYHGNPSLYTDQ